MTILARVVGVSVGHHSGSNFVSGHFFRHYYYSYYYHNFSVCSVCSVVSHFFPLSSFVIEGVLKSKIYFIKVEGSTLI